MKRPRLPSTPGLGARTESSPTLLLTTDAVVEETLISIATMLDGVADSPHVRELRAKARSYERIAQHWRAVRPSRAQRDATLELVMELRAQAAELVARTPSPPRDKSHKE